MLYPTKADDGKSKRKVAGRSQQVTMRLRIAFSAVEVQQDDIGQLTVEFANRCLRTEDLADAVACVFQNFVEDITKSFIRIHQQDALYFC